MSKNIQITIVAGDMDRLAAIKDGRVQVEGCDVTFIPMEPEEVFFRAFRYAEFDCCELSFSSHMRVTSQGKSDYVGIPAFVSRVFRHSGFYVRTDRGIEKPEDLRGKLIGTPEYQMTAPVWMRGILDDQYGIKSNEIRWRSGGQEEAGRDERTPFEAPPGLDLEPIPEDRTLVEMFEAGELDGAGAVFVHDAETEYRPIVPGFPLRGKGILQRDRHLPDHAPDGLAQGPGRETSVVAGQPLQGLRRIPRHCLPGPGQDGSVECCSALGRGGTAGYH